MIHLHRADDASPEDRRGRLIATMRIAEGVSHTAIVPEDLPVAELEAFLRDDFATTADPLAGSLEDLEEKRARVDLETRIADARRAREAAARADGGRP